MDKFNFTAKDKRISQLNIKEKYLENLYIAVKKEILECPEEKLKLKTVINKVIAKRLRNEGFKVHKEVFERTGPLLGAVAMYVVYWDKEYAEHERGDDDGIFELNNEKDKDSKLVDRVIEFFDGEVIEN